MSLTAGAQTNKFTLTGTITMLTGEQFPYKITGTEINGVLKGFSYTYSEPDEAKAIIEGKIDKQHQTVTFKETEIVASHDVHTRAFMCLVHARLEVKNNKLTGPATGKESDNTACTEGVIQFATGSEIDVLFSAHDKYDMVVSMGGKAAPDALQTIAQPTVEAPPAKQEKITSGTEKAYQWISDTIVVDIWDGGTLDGDKVTITFDDQQVLTRYTIQKIKKRILIPLPATGVHYLSIHADEEGSDPPNTASLTLTDGDKHYNLLAYNPKGAQSIVQIKKQKQ